MEPVLRQWHFDPLVLLLVLALIFLHYRLFAATAPKKMTPGKEACFWSAIVLIILATFSPLHVLGMHMYFSAHMITHVILLLLAAPLLVLSLSAAGSRSSFEKISAFLNKRSWLAWTAGVGVMWCWHIPVVLEASITPMQSFSAMPLLHTGSMLAAGILFSWPLFGPVPEQRIHSLPGVFYLFTACISCSLLGLLITFAPLGTFYAYPAANQPMNGMTGNPWNLTPAADQQTAGLIMWVPCCFIYLTGCVYLLRRWFTAPASITYSTTSHE